MNRSLEDVSKTRNSTVIDQAMTMLPQLIQQCELVYGEADGLLASLRPLTGKGSSMSFVKRIQWVFRKSRVGVLRSLLDSLKGTLNLLLSTIDFEIASKSADPNKEMM